MLIALAIVFLARGWGIRGFLRLILWGAPPMAVVIRHGQIGVVCEERQLAVCKKKKGLGNGNFALFQGWKIQVRADLDTTANSSSLGSLKRRNSRRHSPVETRLTSEAQQQCCVTVDKKAFEPSIGVHNWRCMRWLVEATEFVVATAAVRVGKKVRQGCGCLME